MRALIELNMDRHGNPCIRIRHHDKMDSLEQIVLKQFIDDATSYGCRLVSISGYLDAGTNESCENYEIQTNRLSSNLDKPKK